MYRYPLWKYILVIIVMVYAIIYTLPNFYNTYPSINVTQYQEDNALTENISNIIKEKSIIHKGIDNNTIYFDSIDDQLNAYNKLDKSSKYIYTLSNYNHIPKWLYAINAQPVSLGLDLKGGVHFLLQIDTENVKKSRSNQLENNLRNFLIDNGVRYSNVSNVNNKVEFILSDTKINNNTLEILSETFSDYNIEISEKNDKQKIIARLSDDSLADDVKASMKKNLEILIILQQML